MYKRQVDDFFKVVVTLFKRTLNVLTSKQRGTNLAAGGPSHGTTGTMDNPALGGVLFSLDVSSCSCNC